HLVRDEADVDVALTEHGQAGTAAGGGDEQETVVHLDHRPADAAAAEVQAGAPGKAVQAGRHGGEVLRVVAVEALRRADEQPVGGQHDRLLRPLDAADQVV